MQQCKSFVLISNIITKLTYYCKPFTVDGMIWKINVYDLQSQYKVLCCFSLSFEMGNEHPQGGKMQEIESYQANTSWERWFA